MKWNLGLTAALAAFLLMTVAAHADEGLGLAAAGKVSTIGYGVELGYRFNNYLALRTGINKGSLDVPGTSSVNDYAYSISFDNIPVTLDWYVFGGTFRLSGGIVSNSNKITGTASGVLDIGGSAYTGTATTETHFSKTSTYLGFGWGGLPSTTKGFGMSFELGVMGQGAPTTTVTAPGVPPENIAAEETSLNSDLKSLKYWPVVSLGIGYTF